MRILMLSWTPQCFAHGARIEAGQGLIKVSVPNMVWNAIKRGADFAGFCTQESQRGWFQRMRMAVACSPQRCDVGNAVECECERATQAWIV